MTVTVLSRITTPESADSLWAALADIPSHTRWMADAVAIRFLSDQRSGVGTRFECDTRIGPLSTTDVIEITDWEEGRRIGVTHSGLVTGSGAFELWDNDTERVVSWTESLTFPWMFGGRLGELIARPLMARIWRANLRRLVATI